MGKKYIQYFDNIGLLFNLENQSVAMKWSFFSNIQFCLISFFIQKGWDNFLCLYATGLKGLNQDQKLDRVEFVKERKKV